MPDDQPSWQARNAPYGAATRPCDIVMKGGASSGFVYARALTVLAKTYRIQSVGGTSAGAGAAGVAAAAEYGRRRGGSDAHGYAGVEDVPRWAGEIVPATGWTRLKHVFGPDESTRRIYEVITALLPVRPYNWAGAIRAALIAYWPASLVAALIGFAILCAVLHTPLPPQWWAQAAFGLTAVFAVVAAVLLVVGVAAFAFYRDVIRELPKNGFALCSAFAGSGAGGENAPAEKMTDWLYNLYQRLAGLPADRPLTFGDLAAAVDAETGQGIRLNVMTVNVTLGRPHRLPFDDRNDAYWFSPAEFRRLFPEAVVAAMERAARLRSGADRFASKGLLPLPESRDLPIIVAVRMSYALPILFSAVPLYAVDGSRMPDRQVRGEPGSEPAPEHCWFVDGALASNFPVHLFDSPLPRWPTFAINLRQFHPDWRAGDAAHDAWLDHEYVAPGNRGVLREWWTRIDHDPVPGDPTRFAPVDDEQRLKRFLGACLSSMMNWVDNQQLRLPGYRDRVANVSLAPEEGGGHFDMSAARIERIAGRGGVAAQKLVHSFSRGAAAGPGWNQHRWTRYLTALQLAAKFVGGFERGYRQGFGGDTPYREVLEDPACVPDGGDPLAAGQRDVARRLTLALIAEEEALPEDGDANWPRHPALQPEPVMRILPEM